MDDANDPNDGCQPHKQELEQEIEKKWKKAIKSHYDFIVERMSPEFGLIDRLFAHSALTKREKDMLEKKKIIQKKNEMILDCLSKIHKLKTLIELLGKCDQRHLVKYLESDGNRSDEFDGEWPLTDEVISTIDCNYADLVDLLEVSELTDHLYATGVINRRQRDFINSKSTPSEQNAALLDILRRSSLRSYWQTITCLHQTNQSHIAEILTNGAVIMRVDVHLKVKGRKVNEAEEEIATKINNFLNDRSVEESIRIFQQALQMKLIGAKTCHSVSLYFLCNQLEEVKRFEKLTNDGHLKEIVESLFQRLINTPVKIKVDFNWKSDIFTKCLNMFQEKEFPLATINRLPFEALDLILQKSYLAFTQRQNRDQNLEDATFIKQLASVDFCWFKRIINRRYKATVWSRLSRIYKVKNRASYLYNCNQEFIEASLIRLRVDKNALKASAVLSDIEYAINTRTKTAALKKTPPANGAEGLSVFASQRNEAAILYYLRYFHHSKERAIIIKVLQNEGASVRVDIRGRHPNTNEFLQKLRLSMDKTGAESAVVKKLLPELYGNGMEILNLVKDRNTVIWIWCKSTNALSLEKLKQMNESKTTARLFFQLTKVDHQSTNIDCDQLNKDIDLTERVNRYAIVIGGYEAATSVFEDVTKINLHRSDDVSPLQKMPTKMQFASATAVYNNIIYITGVGNNSDEIWKFDAISNIWQRCASLVKGRRKHSVAFVDQFLYICGGYVNYDGSVLDDVEAYDAINDRCSSVGKLVHSVQNAGNCVSFKSSLYIFGGGDASNKAMSHVQVYDTKSNTCNLLSHSMPRAVDRMRAALFEQTIILLGKDNCFLYDLETWTWQERNQFRTEVTYFGMIIDNGQIFVIGGGVYKTVAGGNLSQWICREEVRCIPLKNILEDKAIEWRHHVKLPVALVFSCEKIYFEAEPLKKY